MKRLRPASWPIREPTPPAMKRPSIRRRVSRVVSGDRVVEQRLEALFDEIGHRPLLKRREPPKRNESPSSDGDPDALFTKLDRCDDHGTPESKDNAD